VHEHIHPDLFAIYLRSQHHEMQRAAGEARMVRAARQRPDKRRWRRR